MESREDNDHGSNRAGDRAVDLRYYWTVIKKRRWIIAATIITVTAFAIVFAMRKTKIYQATATVILDPHAPNVLGNQGVQVVQLGSGNYWVNIEYYNTQNRILTSRALARQVVTKYQLHHDARLIPLRPPGASEDALIDEAAAKVQGRISVRFTRESRVFAISVVGSDPKLAADLANYVADVYMEQNLAVKRDVTRYAKGWVAKLLDEARGELQKSETSLYSYKKDHNILSVSMEDRQNMISKALESFSNALTDTQRRRIEEQARRKGVEALLATSSDAEPAGYIKDAPAIETLRDQYLQDRRQLKVLIEKYGPKWPEVVAHQARLDAALVDLKAEGRALLRSLDADLRASKEAETAYSTEIAKLTQEALDLNKMEIEYKRISRDAKNAEEIYLQLLTRLNENALQEQDLANNIRPLDEARVPQTPIEPNPKLAAMVGLALGLLLALGLAFAIEYLDRSVKSQEDIESVIGLPFLGMVPSVEGMPEAEKELAPELYIHRHPNSTVAECCRVVRTNLLFCSPDKPLKSLVVTSSNPVEGKTMSCVNMGIVMAQSGHRTLLVDTDMRRPRLHKALRTSNENGLSRLVVGETDLESAIKTTDVPNLYFLPCGPIPPNPAELLQTEKFAALAKLLSEKFDRVIFDSPPILAVTDAVVLSRVVDGSVIVIRAGRTTRDAVARAKRLISGINPRIVGAILNDVNLKNPHYTGYYNYYHYYHYRYHEAPQPLGSGSASSDK
jgi:capsular exopolysaccharide synthesis family protein